MTDTQSIRTERPNRWIGPLLLLALVATLIILFIVSNAERTTVGFAGFEWENVPVWLVIVIALVAGAIGSRVMGWTWRGWRRRRRRLADELDTLRRHSVDAGD